MPCLISGGEGFREPGKNKKPGFLSTRKQFPDNKGYSFEPHKGGISMNKYPTSIIDESHIPDDEKTAKQLEAIRQLHIITQVSEEGYESVSISIDDEERPFLETLKDLSENELWVLQQKLSRQNKLTP